MLSMEAFHQLLFSDDHSGSSYLAQLLKLTQASLEQLRDLKTGTEWEVWHDKPV